MRTSRVRVLATADNGERLVADYLYQGRHRTLAEWAADDGRPLKTELEAGYRALGEHIYDQVFELLPLPDRRAHSAGGALSTAFGLAPISPASSRTSRTTSAPWSHCASGSRTRSR